MATVRNRATNLGGVGTVIHNQLIDTLMRAVGASLADMHTATIAKVTRVDTKTINCRPVINRLVEDVEIELPEFVEVPPLFMQGGGSYTAHPIAVGDYALLIFTERCFDNWYNGQDFKRPLELRMHDYSDGFALVGINPLGGAITIPTVIQQTGDTNQDGDYTHQGNREQTGNYILTGDQTIDGTLHVTGAITSDSNISTPAQVTGGGKNLSTHTHPAGTPPGDTGAPN